MTESPDNEMDKDLLEDSETYPVMPLRNTVLFPQQVIPIYIGRDKSLKLINELPENSKHIVVVAQEDGSIEDPKPEDMYSYGTLSIVLKVFDMPDNSKSAIVQGIDRVKILDYKEKDPYYRAVVQRISNKSSKDSVELDALANNLRQVFSELIQIAPNLSEEHTGMLSNIQKPARLADRAVSLLTVSNPEKQDILEELDVKKRVEKAIKVLTKEIQRIKLGEEIQTEVHDEIAKSQMADFGAMLSFSLKDDSVNAAIKFMQNTKIFTLAESLGGVESLISNPASMTHGSIPKRIREK